MLRLLSRERSKCENAKMRKCKNLYKKKEAVSFLLLLLGFDPVKSLEFFFESVFDPVVFIHYYPLGDFTEEIEDYNLAFSFWILELLVKSIEKKVIYRGGSNLIFSLTH